MEHLWALRDDPQNEMTGKQKWAGVWEEQSLKGTRREERSKGKEVIRGRAHTRLQVLTLLSTKSRLLLPSVWTAVPLDISSWLSHLSGDSSNSTSSEAPSLIAQPNVALVSLPRPPYDPACYLMALTEPTGTGHANLHV